MTLRKMLYVKVLGHSPNLYPNVSWNTLFLLVDWSMILVNPWQCAFVASVVNNTNVLRIILLIFFCLKLEICYMPF